MLRKFLYACMGIASIFVLKQVLVFVPDKVFTSNVVSVSDNGEYPDFCMRAANSPHIFHQFRRAPEYCKIVETVGYNLGQEYLNIIKKQNPAILNHIEAFKKNDAVGDPQTYFYEGVGYISPLTLRYIKVASDLLLLFGSLEQCSIVEIGGGFGGQCKIISDLCNFKRYVIIDLPGPLALAKKYLEELHVKNVEFITPENVSPGQKFDLVISNYALSEIVTEPRKKYVHDVLKYANRGYLTCNDFSEEHGSWPSKSQIMQELRACNIDFQERSEEPLTSPQNYLLVWTR